MVNPRGRRPVRGDIVDVVIVVPASTWLGEKVYVATAGERVVDENVEVVVAAVRFLRAISTEVRVWPEPGGHAAERDADRVERDAWR